MADAWPEERVERLKALVADGLSASEVATEMKITRNAVIGHCHRKGIELKHKPGRGLRSQPNKPKRVRGVGTKVEKPPKSKFIFGNGQAIHKPPTFIAPVAETVEPKHLTLLQLKETSCRWPYGDEVITFCGHEREGEKISYCHYHNKRSRAR